MRRILLCILLLLAPVTAHADQTLTFGYINQPLSYTSLAVLKAAYAKLGFTVNTFKGPAARILSDSNAGLTDGEVHRIADIAPKYPNLVRVDAQINTVEGMLVSCGPAPKVHSPDELREFRVAVRIGNVYATNLTKDMPHVSRTPDADRMLELLLENRVDFILTDRLWAMTQKEQPGRDCLTIQEPPLVSLPLYHYLHVRHRALVPAIAEVLRKMAKSGEAEAIRRRAAREFPVPLQ